jgi:hypothetical protein
VDPRRADKLGAKALRRGHLGKRSQCPHKRLSKTILDKRHPDDDDPFRSATIKVTKIDVAKAHIRVAVQLFFEGEHLVPVYTLASAAREIVGSLTGRINRGGIGRNGQESFP